MSTRTVEVLFFDGCPNVEPTLERVRAAISQAGAGADGVSVRLVKVETSEHAHEVGFLGSPSVRVDGADVETSARSRGDFALQCRVYDAGGGRLEGAPPVQWIHAALTSGASTGTPPAPAPAHDCCAPTKTA